MSAYLQTLVRVGKRRGRVLWRALHGAPAPEPAFAWMTLDDGDVALARQWLAASDRWPDDDQGHELAAALARVLGARAAFPFASGREALTAAAQALELPAGSEIVVPGYTCIAVPNALRFAGLTPVWADIETETFGLDAAAAARAIGPRTGALLIQHTYGLVCRDYRPLLALARERGLRVLEDCAHALGASLDGVPVGRHGDIAVYSTEQSKVLCTIQGGFAACDDPLLAERLQALHRAASPCADAHTERVLWQTIVGHHRARALGRPLEGDLLELRHARHGLPSLTPEELRGERPAAYGRRMANAVAALGLAQLAKLERLASMRWQTWQRWDAWCESEGLARPLVVSGSRPAALRYPVLVSPERKRDARWTEARLGVVAGRWFETHLHPAAVPVAGCPRADHAVACCINLPTLLP